ncbi:MAG: hypothetical protein J5517_07540 [Eubacterium sp.]|nr:hypothetical protein [Eubacterium sp.]
MKRILFEYKYSVWLSFDKSTELTVYEEDGKYYADCHSFSLELRDEKVSLSDVVVEKIKKIYSKNPTIFEFDEPEFPPVLDGSSHEFVFGNGEVTHEVRASNIWYFKGIDTSDYPNGIKLLKTFESIRRQLIKEGVKKEYLRIK